MNYELLKTTIREKGLTFNSLSKSIGMTQPGITAAIENGTLRIDTLEKISQILGVSPSLFFNDKGTESAKGEEDKWKFFHSILNNESSEITLNVDAALEKSLLACKLSEGFLTFVRETISEAHLRKIIYASSYSLKGEDPIPNPLRYGNNIQFLLAINFYVCDDVNRLRSEMYPPLFRRHNFKVNEKERAIYKNNFDLRMKLGEELDSIYRNYPTQVLNNHYLKFLIDEGLLKVEQVISYIYRRLYRAFQHPVLPNLIEGWTYFFNEDDILKGLSGHPLFD